MKFRKLVAKFVIVALSSYHFGTAAAEDVGGVSFGISTRVIFDSDEKKISFPVSNRTNRHYIFQGLVLNEDLKSYCTQTFIR